MIHDPMLVDLALTAGQIRQEDYDAYVSHRDQWAEQVFFRLGPEGCLEQLKSLSRCRGVNWTSELESRYRRVSTLDLARSALLSLILEVLPPREGSRIGSGDFLLA
jgi:hypothetical protein